MIFKTFIRFRADFLWYVGSVERASQAFRPTLRKASVRTACEPRKEDFTMARVTLNDILVAVNGLGAKIDEVDKRVCALENASKPATASKAKAKAVATKAPKKAKGNAVSEAKKAEHKAATLAYKADKRTRNCLTSKENKLVAKQMREQGLNPADKKAWEKAKAAYIKANPLA